LQEGNILVLKEERKTCQHVAVPVPHNPNKGWCASTIQPQQHIFHPHVCSNQGA